MTVGLAAQHGSPAALLRRFGLRPRKSLGQHFLADARVAAAIAEATGVGPGDTVAEIGAGLGALTVHLLDRGARVLAIERDRLLAAALRELFVDEPAAAITVHEGDALDFDFATLPAGAHVAGNLPYNVSAPLLFKLLESSDHTGPWTLMFQREVARRLAAPPGNKDYGALTAQVTAVRAVRHLRDVGRGVFTPPPKVDSVVIQLTPHPEPLWGDADPAAYRRVVRAAFATRRKTLRNALKAAGIEDAETLLRAAEVDPGARGETLGPEALARIARLLP